MKKNDELKGNSTDEDEDLFDLSLDDLEPEDTIIEAHVDEADEEIIELIDLVEKGDIDLAEETREPGTLIDTIQDLVEDEGDELKSDKTLDLLSVPLDQILELDQLDEFIKEDEGIGAVEIAEVEADLLMEKEPEKPADTIETTEVFFDDIADESALEELIADESVPLKAEPEIKEDLPEIGIEDLEGAQVAPKVDKTMRIYTSDAGSPETVQEIKPEEPEQPELSEVEEKPAVEKPAAPVKEEAAQMPPPEAILTGISEEKIEAVIRKTIEDVVERVTRETLTVVIEKTAREVMTEVIEKTTREVMTGVIEETTRETMTGVQDRIAREMNETVERVARETTSGVAERIISNAIDALKKSIESASEQTV